jgi:hypothetical protein
MMSEAEDFLEDARKSFRLAANSTQPSAVEHYAEMGRNFLRLSHEASKVVVSKPASHWWSAAFASPSS